jgi:ribosomal protein S18 acetylase RimI-like enzyme
LKTLKKWQESSTYDFFTHNKEAYLAETFKTVPRTSPEELNQAIEEKIEHFILLESITSKPFLIGSICVINLNPSLYFGMLSVDPKWQGHSLGLSLMRLVESIAKENGFESVELKVVHVREELIKLYERLGYKKVGTDEWPKHLRHQVDREVHFIVMVKQINI